MKWPLVPPGGPIHSTRRGRLVGFLLASATGLAVGYGLGALLGSWLLQRMGH